MLLAEFQTTPLGSKEEDNPEPTFVPEDEAGQTAIVEPEPPDPDDGQVIG